MSRPLQVLLLCIFTAMLGMGIIGPIMPVYAENLGANYLQIGLLGSAWSISRFVFTAPVGSFSDTHSKKKIIAAGLSVYAGVSLLYALAWDFASLLSVRFIHGIGSAMAMPVAMAYAADITPPGEEGNYMGTMNMAMFAGMSLGPLLGGSLSEAFTISAPFYLMAGLTGLSLALTMLFLPEQERQGEASRRVRPSFRRVLSNRLVLAIFVYRVVNALGRGSIMNFLSLFIASERDVGGLGLTLTIAGTVLSVGQMTTALLQKPFGQLADRFDKTALVLLGGLVSAMGMGVFPFAQGFWGLMTARLVFSLGSALSMPALTAIAAIEGRGMGLGTTMSVVQSAMSVGNMVGPIMMGLLVDVVGLRWIFMVSAAISLIGTGVFFAMERFAGAALKPLNPIGRP